MRRMPGRIGLLPVGTATVLASVLVFVGLGVAVGAAVCQTSSIKCHLRPVRPGFVGDRGGTLGLARDLRSAVVTAGFTQPTDFDFLADGRILVADRDGVVRLVDHGHARRQPFLDLRGRVSTWEARGLVAIAVDRSASPSRLYVAYAVTPEKRGSNPKSGDPTKVRFSRFTIHGDHADPASERIIAGSSTADSCSDHLITADCVPADFDHVGADIVLADDGLMYLSTGDGATGDVGSEHLAQRAQALDSLAGKILRVDRSGRGVRGNPYWDGSPTSNRSRVWALGFRNPFRLSLLPNGDLVAGDVGFNTYDELDVVERAGNYGWPCREARGPTPEFRESGDCKRFERDHGRRVRGPWMVFPHPRWHSLTAGTALASATRLPDGYRPMYAFADWVTSTLWAVPMPSGSQTSGLARTRPQLVGTGLGGPVRLRIGPDGALYLLSLNVGELRSITAAES